MKRLLFITPLLFVLGACGATTKSSSSSQPAKPVLSRSAILDEVPLRLDVAGLRRRGRTAALDLRLVNRAPRGGDVFSIGDTFSRAGHYDMGGVLLLDPRTGHELGALEDDVDFGFTEIAGGGSQMLSVSFPAPRGTTADVLVPHFGLFRSVPVH
jgi:hypothetical protein